MTPGKTCSTCAAYEVREIDYLQYTGKTGQQYGRCHLRMPPRGIPFPLTRDGEWCLEWRPREELFGNSEELKTGDSAETPLQAGPSAAS